MTGDPRVRIVRAAVPATIKPGDLTEGVNYLLVTMAQGQRSEKVWLMSWVGEANDPHRPTGIWNARPAAGTQMIPWDQVVRLRPMRELPVNQRDFGKRFCARPRRIVELPDDGWLTVDAPPRTRR